VLNGQPITVREGVCVDATGTLAGCDLDMASAVRNMHTVGAGLVEALSMASANPAAFLGLSDRIGILALGAQADFVWLDRDLQVRGTWIGGARFNCP
jgi:N-acetylglucosamine-6-phosphate deacetylase